MSYCNLIKKKRWWQTDLFIGRDSVAALRVCKLKQDWYKTSYKTFANFQNNFKCKWVLVMFDLTRHFFFSFELVFKAGLQEYNTNSGFIIIWKLE
ncbi:unnamed protein product [Acanthoscelides obtectus]|uniref:Uncharacterized protein n=1 Tax=Acanthoscelides obtectus TaxID=200917 RepID=A0A9P0LJE4_ACAOB|nr:unnamed protein product [Acanthoscelides obtectus]CAK1676984.1 hypothetical protein AOBTE_LOCUS31046 [Acanthoscelides obtectus]